MPAEITRFLFTAIGAGILAGAGMEGVLWFLGVRGWAKTDMIVALGSLFTRTRETARHVGLLLHAVAAVGFALFYVLLMVWLGCTHLPASLALGLGVGFAHGLIVSLGLVWVVAERHPLEEFNEAGLAIGLSHILGHVVYGGIVGLVVGASGL